MGGLLGKSPDAPGFEKLDSETQKLLDLKKDKSSRSAADFIGELNEHLDQGLLSIDNSPESIQAESASKGVDPNFHKAMMNKYYTKSKQAIDRLKSYSSLEGENKKSEELAKMSRALIGQERARTQQYEILTQAYNQQEASKANMINSLFQLGSYGMMMGMSGQKPTVNNVYDKSTSGGFMGIGSQYNTDVARNLGAKQF